MRRAQVYRDDGGFTAVLQTGERVRATEPIWVARHGVKVHCPDCGFANLGSDVDTMGYLACRVGGDNEEVSAR